jgi:hypothetical protein
MTATVPLVRGFFHWPPKSGISIRRRRPPRTAISAPERRREYQEAAPIQFRLSKAFLLRDDMAIFALVKVLHIERFQSPRGTGGGRGTHEGLLGTLPRYDQDLPLSQTPPDVGTASAPSLMGLTHASFDGTEIGTGA